MAVTAPPPGAPPPAATDAPMAPPPSRSGHRRLLFKAPVLFGAGYATLGAWFEVLGYW